MSRRTLVGARARTLAFADPPVDDATRASHVVIDAKLSKIRAERVRSIGVLRSGGWIRTTITRFRASGPSELDDSGTRSPE
jgi:hypothetical protein